MLSISNYGAIKLTRGDSAYIAIGIKSADGADYQPYADDVLTLTVKKTVNDAEPAFQKTVTGWAEFKIEPADTANLEFGKYKYDVQLQTATGDIYTIIEPTEFEIGKEVTY